MQITNLQWQHTQPLFLPLVILLGLGLVMVATSSMGIADQLTGNYLYFTIRQVAYTLLGMLVFYGFTLIPVSRWQQLDVIFLAIAVLALFLVFAPVIGHEVKGSRRWLNLGIIKVQASEIAKLAIVLYIAGYLVRRQAEVMQSWKGFLRPFIIIALILALLLLEPDFGAAFVLSGAVMVQLFLGGVKAGQYFLLLIVAIVLGVIALSFESYRVERLMAYLDPWSPEHVYGTGYQLTQSLIAFGRGELFGVGLGESIQKLFYLPEAHTDFVFAIWAEETGLIGGLIALAMLVWLVAVIWFAVWKTQKTGQMYASYVCTGIAVLFSLQILINIGVNTGLLPTKGLTLPFYSYGGSSLLICCVMVAIVQRVLYEASVQEVSDEK